MRLERLQFLGSGPSTELLPRPSNLFVTRMPHTGDVHLEVRSGGRRRLGLWFTAQEWEQMKLDADTKLESSAVL